MGKTVKKIAAIILIVLLSMTFVACNPICELFKSVKNKDRAIYFEYDGWSLKSDPKKSYLCTICGISKDILSREEFILPSEIDGKGVDGFEENHSSQKTPCKICGNSSQNIFIKKIFIGESNYKFSGTLYTCFPHLNAKKIFTSPDPFDYSNGFTQINSLDNWLLPYRNSKTDICVPKTAVNDFEKKYSFNTDARFKPANVTYWLVPPQFLIDLGFGTDLLSDYIHWVDDLEVGDKIQTIPENPDIGLAGVEFLGWYLDDEFTVKLDFDTFVKGEDEIDIYAKWALPEEFLPNQPEQNSQVINTINDFIIKI